MEMPNESHKFRWFALNLNIDPADIESLWKFHSSEGDPKLQYYNTHHHPKDILGDGSIVEVTGTSIGSKGYEGKIVEKYKNSPCPCVTIEMITPKGKNNVKNKKQNGKSSTANVSKKNSSGGSKEGSDTGTQQLDALREAVVVKQSEEYENSQNRFREAVLRLISNKESARKIMRETGYNRKTLARMACINTVETLRSTSSMVYPRLGRPLKAGPEQHVMTGIEKALHNHNDSKIDLNDVETGIEVEESSTKKKRKVVACAGKIVLKCQEKKKADSENWRFCSKCYLDFCDKCSKKLLAVHEEFCQ